MKRSRLVRHARLERTRFRVRSRGATEKRATGRPAATVGEWTATKLALLERSGGRCEVTLGGIRCRRTAVDPCHWKNRSQGAGDGLDEVFAGCRTCHRQMDAPYRQGKLVCHRLGNGRFEWEVIVADDKWALRGFTPSGRDGAPRVGRGASR